MSFEEYSRTYYNFQALMQQTAFVRQISSQLMKEFPSCLPDYMIESFNSSLEQIKTAMEETKVETVNLKLNYKSDNIALRTTLLVYTLEQAGRSIQNSSDINFERVIFSQDLITMFTYLEAFLVDSVATICRSKPDVMKNKERQMDWDAIISAGCFNKILDILVEDYSSNFFNQLSVTKSTELIKKKFGITVKVLEPKLELLDKARRLRHAIVHNGGRADLKYLRETRRTDVVIGDHIPVDVEHLVQVFTAMQVLAKEVFIGISAKFFGKTAKDIVISF